MGFWRNNFVFGTFRADELLGSDHKDTVFGFSGGDVISTFRGRDLIFAGAGNDTIDAGDGRDTVYAGSGNDEIIGSRGNDTIFGGRGLDLVTYEGSIDDYAIETLSRSRYTVTSLDMTLGDAGRDLLRQVEALYFIEDDLTLFIDGRNNVVRAGNDATETSENAVLEILADDLLANDRDFDGDALTITSVDSTSASGAQVSFVDGVIRYDPGSLFDALAEGETTIDTFTYVVDDGLDGADTATVTVTITGTNDDPVLTAPAMVSVEENSTAVTTVSAMDVDGTTVTFSLGGDDAALFAITPEGALSFIFAPDFEAPSDANQDNTYNVTVIATDEAGGTDDQAIEVIVTDVDETPPLVARINELHYDNDGTDVGEFIEIRVDKGGDVSNLIVELYNGNGGGVYTTLTVSDGTLTGDDMFDYYVLSLPANGIQNGSPDGLALSNGGALIEFLSYEGTFDGVGGAADGATSTDIGVAESGTTLIGQSLQRNDDGSWREPEDDTPGAANVQVAAPLEARINELHYDNDGTDTGEFIEVRVAAGGDVSGLIVELYNGNGGGVYSTLTVSDGSQTTDGDFDYYVLNLPSNGIQNGSPDGLALSNGEGLIEFLSYEGTFDGFGGAADGVTSTDIGVAESGSTPVGDSLQRNDDGTWRGPEANTSGAANVAPVSARINELHYDNDGTDTGEFIEIRVDAGDDVSGLLVELYNGNGGGVYGSFPVSGATMTSDGAFDYYVIALPSNGIQNGPDGVALSNGGQLIEFLSYEGTFAGVGGAADGVTSTDIGVVESNSTPIGQSLQRNADGTWRGPEANTQGADNDGAVEPPEPKLISEVQGSGDSSDFVGMAVTLSAVVTHVVSNGYYLQEEDADADADAATSEGIFVFTGDMPSVSVGNQITVSGAIAEFFGATQLTSVTSEVIDVVSVDLPTPAEIMLDPAVAQDFEAVEGMQVVVSSGTSDPLTVIENFNLDRFGDVTISAGVQTQPTQLFDAQTEANEIAALQEANANNRLLLDDANGSQNPDEFAYLPGGAGDNGNGLLDAGDDFGDAGTTLRLGSELSSDARGVLTFAFGEYRLVVTETLEIDETTNSGARDAAPDDVGGTLQVASVNALNYFTTLDNGSGGSGPNDLSPRGADTADELVRQTDKLVTSLQGTGAEVFALQEVENNGFGPDSAVQTLADALNNAIDPNATDGPFLVADPTGGTGDGFIGTDAITTGIIYDSRAVTLVASDFIVFDESSAATTFALAEVLNAVVPSSDQVGDFQRNRPSVAATFEDNESGETFTVVSSHFKSKGDSNLQDVVDAAQSYLDNGGTDITQADIDALIADPNFDQGNGQGFWNQVRLDAATELGTWIETQYNGTGVTDYILLGDLNAYAQEDPVQQLDDEAGLVDLIDTFIGQDEAYSFVFDGQRGTLDQGLASESLAARVTGATEWHINADEPDLINYDTSFNNPNFFNPGPFAASDHDPLIVGLDFATEDPLTMV